MTIDFSGQVAIVTGGANGLGREYALALAKRRARVMVNDLGCDSSGRGNDVGAVEQVVQEIRNGGGEALSSDCSVTDNAGVLDMVERTVRQWGRVDILINNAGILQSGYFARAAMADFRQVVEVNLIGSALCSHAVWHHMRRQGFGRILMTTSEGALYPVPGAASYAAAKLGLVGLMNALSAEGRRDGICVNTIAPAAATRMTRDIVGTADLARMDTATVVAAALYLVSAEAPSGAILAAGAKRYERAYITHTQGLELPELSLQPEGVGAHFEAISDRFGDEAPQGFHAVARGHLISPGDSR
ncbi:SDR family NAD(P)-dependent oxidoreductase [Novosphingobium aquae]|uniref:SDR family NAD(P)-dependent oxidoreductase n=1 Tax=Novosphingobium aquae TaxID=3133435 RepID=A0ABU8S5X6_9SPHN